MAHGWPARHMQETTPEEREVIHKVFCTEIYCSKSAVKALADMGSTVCKKILKEKGWKKFK